jgi:hypothetical protein
MNYTKLKGVDVAIDFARSGKFIFAIKHLEKANPEITREQAKAAVESFGYGRRSKPAAPEER